MSRKVRRALFQAAALVSLLAVAPLTWAWLHSDGHRSLAGSEGWVSRVPYSPTGLVLGAGLYGGRPSPMLASRLDIAAELFHAGKLTAVLVSGDNSRAGYDEPTAMRDYLATRGVPPGRIVLDYAGFDTWDSCLRARHVFGADRVTVITQRFHLPRAVALCRTAGLDAFGVGDDSGQRWPKPTLAYAAREVTASAKGLADAILNSAPVFPGPRESSLTLILTHHP